jgi:hypothetical protein
MKFECPFCKQHLTAGPEASGQVVRCPSCDKKIQIPVIAPEPGQETAPAPTQTTLTKRRVERKAWKETDPTNPHLFKGIGIGVGILVVWYALLFPFNPPAGTPLADYSTLQFLASLFYRHFVVSALNTFFFAWAISIIVLKYRKIRHQKAALLLDVLPVHLGKEIDPGNVGLFIDHVYQLPVKLRDSLMVNRIRKGLELYEIRHDAGEVREMMAAQSEIDSARIGTSYTLLRAFLWAIPLMGFIGTVVGLSQAIGGMNFANVEDITKIVKAINNVTSGLGTAFDATLLGLVLAMTLNFPLNSLAKQEDDTLNSIDAFCNEVLLPRLKESTGTQTGAPAGSGEEVAALITEALEQFLAELNALTVRMNEYAGNLDSRMAELQKNVTTEFVTNTAAMRAEVQGSLKESMDQIVKFQQTLGSTVSAKHDELRAQAEMSIKESTAQATRYLSALEAGITSLNKVLKELGEKQVVIQQTKKKRWFGRD